MYSSIRRGGRSLHPALLFSVLVLGVFVALPASANSFRGWWQRVVQDFIAANDVGSYDWDLINGDSEWSPRAGLQVVSHRGDFYLMGGRTPNPPSFPFVPGDSVIWGDVWKSEDRGESWTRILETNDDEHWPARAYFQAVKKGRYMYVIGGQNFQTVPNECPPFVPDCPAVVPTSEFFSDVWRSRDGVHWEQRTEDAGFAGRAGLSAAVHRRAIYVIGGSVNDDEAIVEGAPAREYFNDVWKSYDGKRWILVTDNAPWQARAGAVVVSKGRYLYLIGGEDGFVCEPLPFCEPPYFNDVWRSVDGRKWEQMTAAADWVARPGHQCVVVLDKIACFGGFGLLANPMDVWTSRNGADWKQVSETPWNATDPSMIKYDFDALVVRDGFKGSKPKVYTFGGDRETFDFADPTNYLNVDNDVWRFAPPAD